MIKIADIIRNKYEQFDWLPEWVEYAETIPPIDPALCFYKAVIRYGLDCIEPEELRAEDLQYFNEKVRPELDRQHHKMDKRKKRRGI